MIKFLIMLLKKYEEIVWYLFVGGCTTLVNIICYYLLSNIFFIGTFISVPIAWFLSVTFAYFSNKFLVFKNNKKINILEIAIFFKYRILTGLLDLVLMYIFVDLIGFNNMTIKIISNIIVIVLNYLFSKIFVFKKRGGK